MSSAQPQPSSQTEPSVLSAALSTHESAIRSLIALRVKGRGDAAIDDILQEVALAAHQHQSELIAPDAALSWLRSVAIRKVQDYWRKVQRQDHLKDRLHNEPATLDATSPFEWLVRAEARHHLADALAQLPENLSSVLELKYLQDLRYAAIAERLGVTEKNVEYRLMQAREHLRHLLKEYSYE